MIHYKKEDSYLKYEGRVTMVGNFSEAFAEMCIRDRSGLQTQLKRTIEERDMLQKELAEYKTNADWDNRKLKNEVETIKANIKFKDSEIARLEKEIAGVKKQLLSLIHI